MYLQKKNGVWWLRAFLTANRNDDTAPKTKNRNLGKNYKLARRIVVEELEKYLTECKWMNDTQKQEYKTRLLEKMELTEKENPSYVTLKLTYRQYEKIKSHLPPELRNL